MNRDQIDLLKRIMTWDDKFPQALSKPLAKMIEEEEEKLKPPPPPEEDVMVTCPAEFKLETHFRVCLPKSMIGDEAALAVMRGEHLDDVKDVIENQIDKYCDFGRSVTLVSSGKMEVDDG